MGVSCLQSGRHVLVLAPGQCLGGEYTLGTKRLDSPSQVDPSLDGNTPITHQDRLSYPDFLGLLTPQPGPLFGVQLSLSFGKGEMLQALSSVRWESS